MTIYRDPIETLRQHASQRAERQAYGYLSFGGQRFETFQRMNWAEVWEWVQAYAQVLKEEGIEPGDRVILQGKNQVDWVLIDMAILATGGVSVPVFPQVSAKELGYIINESEAKIFLTDQAQSASDLKLIHFQEIFEKAKAFRGKSFEPVRLDPDSLATLIYTSGTTGEPKGVMHSLRNISTALELGRTSLGVSEKDRIISYLPLCHVAERTLSEFGGLYTGASVFFVDQVEKVVGYIPQVKPTLFFAVPRVWNLLLHRLEREIQHNELVQKRLQSIPSFVRPWIVSFLVKKKLGFSKVKHFYSGAAKLNAEVAQKLSQYGIAIRECYGLTETMCLSTVAAKNPKSFGNVGRTYPGVQLKIEEDGEICLKADFHFLGYYKRPDFTEAAIKNGWFHTGDVGRLDEKGRLMITDRKKEIFKQSNGKYVAPAPIESQIRAIPGVQDAMVIGEEKAYCVALISIQPGFEPTHYIRGMERINSGLNPHERVKHIGLLPKLWGVDSGELTPSMKLRRKVITARYRKEIDALFECREKALYFGEPASEEGERKNCAHSHL